MPVKTATATDLPRQLESPSSNTDEKKSQTRVKTQVIAPEKHPHKAARKVRSRQFIASMFYNVLHGSTLTGHLKMKIRAGPRSDYKFRKL